MWLAPHTTNIAGGNRVLVGAEVSVGLGERTIEMLIDNRKRTHASLPVVLTGADAFDDLFVVQVGPMPHVAPGWETKLAPGSPGAGPTVGRR